MIILMKWTIAILVQNLKRKSMAIISIADSVEAAVRSMTSTPEQIKNLIDSIVQDRLKDGQLNECDITLKEIEVIKKHLVKR